MALYGHEIHASITPFKADLAWIVKLDKGDFIGRTTLAAQKANGVKRKLVGFEMLDRGIARQGYAIYSGDAVVGSVTSGTQTPYLKKAIGLGYVPTPLATVGSEFEVDVRGRRLRARVVPTPFYKRTK